MKMTSKDLVSIIELAKTRKTSKGNGISLVMSVLKEQVVFTVRIDHKTTIKVVKPCESGSEFKVTIQLRDLMSCINKNRIQDITFSLSDSDLIMEQGGVENIIPCQNYTDDNELDIIFPNNSVEVTNILPDVFSKCSHAMHVNDKDCPSVTVIRARLLEDDFWEFNACGHALCVSYKKFLPELTMLKQEELLFSYYSLALVSKHMKKEKTVILGVDDVYVYIKGINFEIRALRKLYDSYQDDECHVEKYIDTDKFFNRASGDNIKHTIQVNKKDLVNTLKEIMPYCTEDDVIRVNLNANSININGDRFNKVHNKDIACICAGTLDYIFISAEQALTLLDTINDDEILIEIVDVSDIMLYTGIHNNEQLKIINTAYRRRDDDV